MRVLAVCSTAQETGRDTGIARPHGGAIVLRSRTRSQEDLSPEYDTIARKINRLPWTNFQADVLPNKGGSGTLTAVMIALENL